MIFDFTYYEPWHPPFSYRESLRGAGDVAWITPADALKFLIDAGAQAPMPLKALLVRMAASGSLTSLARVVVEVEQGASDQGRYLDVPLSTEWASDEWQWEHADLWHDGTMRMTKTYGGALLTRTFRDIVFDRRVVEDLAERWSGDLGCEGADLAIQQQAKQERWSEERMRAAIAACPETNREKAWITYFRDNQLEHGWKNTAWRVLWASARGTEGHKGRLLSHS